MSKICSLDFLNKEEFDLDIISTGGRKLFSKGDKVTPEVLLSLYFKDVLAREPMKTPEEIEEEKNKAKLEAGEEIEIADEEVKAEQPEEAEVSESAQEDDAPQEELPKAIESEAAEEVVEEEPVTEIENLKD